MRPRRPRSVTLTEWPPTLRYCFRAAELECPPGHADALLALSALALRKVPTRGIFDPGLHGEHELFAAIEAVATEHLELGPARAAWRAALEAADLGLELRDDIEQAALRVQGVSDTAYFYAGLAFGLATMCMFREG
jgi:hypothetical protein